ncbi:Regulator of nucleoside diphosphate kinase [uncultured Alphaproteobacteria bacterium]|uniref:Regulator of nucleoside diphosphate kinase n=1 Tax=uncultured Alphaproteobacteria bacterium TaxID=91750 RepID=A0A212KJY1_9PROT|nr:Regulator of nucleoside diphosphate kinase [uncultured Alphaproteobacteria bacterium]
MPRLSKSPPLPKIVLAECDFDRLARLAEAGRDWDLDVADELRAELDRGRVVPTERMPADVVRMGSTVTFESDAGPARRVTLVYPAEADIGAGRISVLTPVGTALIGLRVGQSIGWTARDGRSRSLTVVAVEN